MRTCLVLFGFFLSFTVFGAKPFPHIVCKSAFSQAKLELIPDTCGVKHKAPCYRLLMEEALCTPYVGPFGDQDYPLFLKWDPTESRQTGRDVVKGWGDGNWGVVVFLKKGVLHGRTTVKKFFRAQVDAHYNDVEEDLTSTSDLICRIKK